MIAVVRLVLAGGLLSATIAGCSAPRPALIPMETLRDAVSCATVAPALLVMLPGAYSRPEEFRTQGFVSAVRRRALAADIVLADAHLGYFTERSVIRRVREDIVLPNRRAGYRQVWLVGISIGGLAALGYAARHGDEIDGAVLIAPYPGSREVLSEIAQHGGPAAWRRRWRTVPGGAEDDLEREVWAWLADATTAPEGTPGVYLGYGRDDRFADGNRMMATLLPAGRSMAVPGGHDWTAWRPAWEAWLDRGLLPMDCAGSPPQRS